MADDLRKLLMYIVERPLMQSEQLTAEVGATAVQDVPAEVASIRTDERADAERLMPYFEQGIRLAMQNNGLVTVDDTDPNGNGIADAFARFLVKPNIASSQSTEISEGHYRYTFELDWPRLTQLANAAGANLSAL